MYKMELIVTLSLYGYHVYNKNWTGELGEELYCERDFGKVITLLLW